MRCFVIMPFGDPDTDPGAASRSRSLFEKWIKRAVESVPDPDRQGATIECVRGDNTHRPGDVIEHIVQDLVEADIVIADLTGRNPNVFYELGVRHATATGTILIAQSENDVPFDLRRQRMFFYAYEPDSLLELQEKLVRAITEVISERGRIDSQVRRFLYEREASKIARTGVPGYDVVRDILLEMSRMRADFARELAQFQALFLSASPPSARPAVQAPVLSKLEGLWRTEDGFGIFYLRFADGAFRMPYCFTRDDRLDSHFFEINVVDQILVARFAWFAAPLRGHVVMRIVGPDRLEGGWWLDGDLPAAANRGWLLQNVSLLLSDRMITPLVLVRAPAEIKAPQWVERYFNERMWLAESTSEGSPAFDSGHR